ncbi:sister chromatid cohesion 1 protein 4-like isoform X1 [Salvia hispanica]|uniref:sister chromatid cohesion 1 protein 4-like isoform X1 n=1 Tax=Salvia hispanica TaxID=49212 RepID=UPI002009A179|nr:sister chromatid cohesion 1 protein 4-like isoform X1 [Salvia hispanica]
MFYSQFILAKKGPLGTIWIAAHLERKLRKNQVADTDIGVSVDSILSPDVPIALRLSSHLLLGVVRIYSRKVNYLFDDCSEALLNVKQAFRSAAVDLPPEQSKAPYHTITLPETFDLDDFELPDNEIFHGNFVDHHISSREQITLQDTLDGVTYSTSKFGLDERFGDGDASGLDLDEELFLDKDGTAGLENERCDPQASVGPMTPLKQDEHPEIRNADSGTKVDDVDVYDDLINAQAPSTPGLVEEPNLSNVQEVSAFDDHMEAECRLGESTVIENADNNINEDKQGVNWFSHDNKICDAVPVVPPEDNGHQSGGLGVDSSKPLRESLTEANMEHNLVETLAVGQDKSVNSSLELDDKINGASQAPCQNADADGMNSICPVDEDDHHQGPFTGIEKSAREISGEASNYHQDEPFPQNRETKASNELGDPNSSNLNVHEKVASSETPFLRPCNSNLEQPDFVSKYALSADASVQSDVIDLATSEAEEMVMIGKGCSGADNPEEVLEEKHMQEHALREGTDAASNEPNSHVTNAGAHDGLVDNLNSSAEADLPAPEKLLSVPEDINQHNNMFTEMGSGEFVGLDASDAGSKIISGKKRSFTESAWTEQSLNSVESSRLVRFKRTVESVPDDDDLLSSILVGKSSVLKVKATPRPSEAASTKRTHATQRTSAPKRKVFMDDTMVLHGDMIRLQLTNSEDIRRVRKKAPCTQSEISLIQKKYLEDDCFLGPLFTGISIELESLHSRTWNLSGIRVCNDEPSDSSLGNVADARVPSKEVPPEDSKENDDYSLATVAEPHSMSQDAENCEAVDIGMHNAAEQNRVTIANEHSSHRDSETPLLTDNGVNKVHEMNVEIDTCDKPNSDMEADVSKHEPLVDVSGREMSEKSERASDFPASVIQLNPATETCEELTFVNADLSTGLLDQERDAPSVELHYAMMDADNRQAIEDVLLARDGDVNAGLETEPLERDDVFLEVAQENATVEAQSNSKQELEFDEYNQTRNAIFGENIEFSSFTADQDFAFMENIRSPEQPEAHYHDMMGAESSGFNMHNQEEWKYSAAENDTDFLNVDDDELNEMVDDQDIADEEETRFIENTGWSSRTRAVSKYLQTLFVKEAEQGRRSLNLEHLLVGKSRKEASRMFFETLVLKTRDYIHVEQQVSFDGIALKPRTRLMKSNF